MPERGTGGTLKESLLLHSQTLSCLPRNSHVFVDGFGFLFVVPFAGAVVY